LWIASFVTASLLFAYHVATYCDPQGQSHVSSGCIEGYEFVA